MEYIYHVALQLTRERFPEFELMSEVIPRLADPQYRQNNQRDDCGCSTEEDAQASSLYVYFKMQCEMKEVFSFHLFFFDLGRTLQEPFLFCIDCRPLVHLKTTCYIYARDAVGFYSFFLLSFELKPAANGCYYTIIIIIIALLSIIERDSTDTPVTLGSMRMTNNVIHL